MGDLVSSRIPARRGNRERKRAAPNEYDPLLPSQYYDRVVGGRPPSGEFKLFFAILEDALRCYVRSRGCRSVSKQAEFLDAHVWFHTRGTPHLFCFESICSFLGIDPDWLRGRLEFLTPTDFPLKQYRTRRRRPARTSARREENESAQAEIASPTAPEICPADGNENSVLARSSITEDVDLGNGSGPPFVAEQSQDEKRPG
jgi:hypothetical protein